MELYAFCDRSLTHQALSGGIAFHYDINKSSKSTIKFGQVHEGYNDGDFWKFWDYMNINS